MAARRIAVRLPQVWKTGCVVHEAKMKASTKIRTVVAAVGIVLTCNGSAAPVHDH
jgi:hypothetical protein